MARIKPGEVHIIRGEFLSSGGKCTTWKKAAVSIIE
jgi:hypothetical protein